MLASAKLAIISQLGNCRSMMRDLRMALGFA
jgi:hypothetical protein